MLNLIIYTLMASIIAGCGLLSNSMPAIIASMIISPLLQPISNKLLNISTVNKPLIITFVLVFIVILTGVVMGAINNKLKYFHEESEHMSNIISIDNNKPHANVITEVIIALTVGIGLPYAIINKDATLLVAFGIAPSITPPLVNSGLYLSNYLQIKTKKYLKNAIKSMLIGIANILVILSVGLVYSAFYNKK